MTNSASKHIEATINLHYTRFHEVAEKVLAFYNERQTILYRVAQAYHKALIQAKKELPENTFYQLRTTAIAKISTRINGGRYVSYRGYENRDGVAFMIDGKRIRVDYHEIDHMLSVMVLDEHTIQSPKKAYFKPLESLSGYRLSTGGNTVTFDSYSLQITLNPIEGQKWAKSRTENSKIWKFIRKSLTNMEWFGSQNATYKIISQNRDGATQTVTHYYGDKLKKVA